MTTPDGEPYVKVSLAAIYGKLLSVESTLIELRGQMVASTDDAAERRAEIRDIDRRVRRLEARRLPLPVISVLVAVAALAWTFIHDLLKG